jgi:hypothetical protein
MIATVRGQSLSTGPYNKEATGDEKILAKFPAPRPTNNWGKEKKEGEIND